MANLPPIPSFSGVHLFEFNLRSVSDGVSVAAAGGSRDATLHITRATTDGHPQM